MKYLFFLLIVLLLAGGCAAEVEEGTEEVQVGVLSDEQILQEYHDGLDDAVAELDAVEG